MCFHCVCLTELLGDFGQVFLIVLENREYWLFVRVQRNTLLCCNCVADLSLCLVLLLLVSLFLCERRIVCAMCTWKGMGHFTQCSSEPLESWLLLMPHAAFIPPAPLFTDPHTLSACTAPPPLLPWLLYSTSSSSFLSFSPNISSLSTHSLKTKTYRPLNNTQKMWSAHCNCSRLFSLTMFLKIFSV